MSKYQVLPSNRVIDHFFRKVNKPIMFGFIIIPSIAKKIDATTELLGWIVSRKPMRVLPKVLILKLVLLNHIIIQRLTDIVSCRHIEKSSQALWVISYVWSTLTLWYFIVKMRQPRKIVHQDIFLSWNIFEHWCIFLA